MEASYTSKIEESFETETNHLELIKSGPPHESLFLVLAYLPLLELLAMREVCPSLRNAVNNDVLLWLHIIVDRPLNSRITDEILAEISSKANGRLQSLVLLNCEKITDDGLLWVVRRNPLINKLYIPGCTGLTIDGVIMAVKTLTEHHQNLKSLEIDGVYNIQKEHLETLESCLEMNQHQKPAFYHHRNFSSLANTDRSIDVDICPKCDEVRMVYDCPKKTCSCRGCVFCIPRCEECGECVEELGEAVCVDTLCLECWFRLQKCNFCNKPYCTRHAYEQCGSINSTGFVCEVCQGKFIETSYDLS